MMSETLNEFYSFLIIESSVLTLNNNNYIL